MGHPRPFRFGLQASGPMSASDWAELARKTEDLGYSTLTCADHFGDQFAPFPALTAAAAATSTLRLGTLVLANDYRHPVVTAKDAATVDVLSDGRLELGLGAGWMTSDYEAAGIPLDPPGVRIDRMAEGLAVIRGLFADGPFSFAGEHYRIDGLEGRPRPVQAHVPVVIGGGGPRVLRFAAQHADVVGINVNLAVGVIDERAGPNATEDATQAKVDLVREAAGDRYGSIELQVRVHAVVVTDDRQGMAELMAPALGISPEAALASPHALAGSAEQIADDLLARRERWDL
ncbi:MAG TPA: TIGR03621 family F420-dependent LLM class oxidoreductase, partial [Acidimicrobiales bacterium]|nr:TIGR03621 family F420-dependent LLM class oxidoreductase [Acidimicrobiales bacterium]